MNLARKSIAQYRLGNNKLVKGKWNRRYFCSYHMDATGEKSTEHELLTAATPRIVTRSKGTAKELPNVQNQILEYK